MSDFQGDSFFMDEVNDKQGRNVHETINGSYGNDPLIPVENATDKISSHKKFTKKRKPSSFLLLSSNNNTSANKKKKELSGAGSSSATATQEQDLIESGHNDQGKANLDKNGEEYSTIIASLTSNSASNKKQKKKRAKTKISDLPSITEAEMAGYIKLVHRALKKQQKLSIAKLIRKKKQELPSSALSSSDPSTLSTSSTPSLAQDLEIYRLLDIDFLCKQAWEIHELKTKPSLLLSLSSLPIRTRELCLLLLHSPIVKKSFEQMTKKRIREHQHKSYLKSKKKAAKEEFAGEKDKGKEDAKVIEKLCKLREGEVVQGLVDGVESFGVFVDFWSKKQQYRGLIHISEITGGKIEKVGDFFDIGDPVRCVVLKIDKDNLRVSLTLQKKYFPAGDPGWVVASNKFKKTDGTTLSATQKSNRSANDASSHNLESTFVSSLKDAAPVSDLVEKKKKKSELVKLLAMAKGVSKKRMGQRQRQELLTNLYGETGEQVKPTKQKKFEDGVVKEPRKPFKPIGRAEQKKRKRLRESAAANGDIVTGSTDSAQISAHSSLKSDSGSGSGTSSRSIIASINTSSAGSNVVERKQPAHVSNNNEVKKTPKSTVKKSSASEKKGNKKSEQEKQQKSTISFAPAVSEKKVAKASLQPEKDLHPSWAAKKKEGALPEFQGKRVIFH